MNKDVEEMIDRVCFFRGTKEEFQELARDFKLLVHDPNLDEKDRNELSGYGEMMIHLDMYYNKRRKI